MSEGLNHRGSYGADFSNTCSELGLPQQAIYCYTQAIKGDRTDVESMFSRAYLLKAMGNQTKVWITSTIRLQSST